MTYHPCDLIWLATCGAIGALATWLGQHYGYKRGYSVGYGDGKSNISATHAFDAGRKSVLRGAEARMARNQAFDMGRKSGQRETAAYLAESDIPAVRAAGKALLEEGWGK